MRLSTFFVFGLLAPLVVLSGCDSAPGSPGAADAVDSPCSAVRHLGDDYTVCTFSAADDDIRLFHSDAANIPFLQFDTLARELDEQGETLVFAMNGGMYHDDRSPVGFYRDLDGDRASINTNDGPGNFHMRPNGVFWLDEGRTGITESQAYIDADLQPRFATQSGPMLVISGTLHPDISDHGTSRKRRNGVGVSTDGTTVYFAISEDAVTFHDFATLFRDALQVPDALFLDGQVSRLYAPSLGRNEPGLDMGPIVGVIE